MSASRKLIRNMLKEAKTPREVEFIFRKGFISGRTFNTQLINKFGKELTAEAKEQIKKDGRW